MTAALLCLLALLDSTLCGFRAAAGRSGLIMKRGYYLAAMRRGFIWGLLIVSGLWAAAGLLLLRSDHPAALWSTWMKAGQGALWIYGPYAALILFAISLWAMPRTELRLLATVLVLGPFTLIRPYALALGILAGIAAQPRVEVVLLAAPLAAAMLMLERALGWRYQSRPELARLNTEPPRS